MEKALWKLIWQSNIIGAMPGAGLARLPGLNLRVHVASNGSGGRQVECQRGRQRQRKARLQSVAQLYGSEAVQA